MGRPHMRDFVNDRIKGRWQSLVRFVHFKDCGKAADMPKLDDRWDLVFVAGKEPGIRRASTLALRQESAGVGPSGGAQRNNAGTGRC